MKKSKKTGSADAQLNGFENEFSELLTSEELQGIHNRVQTGLKAGFKFNVRAVILNDPYRRHRNSLIPAPVSIVRFHFCICPPPSFQGGGLKP